MKDLFLTLHSSFNKSVSELQSIGVALHHDGFRAVDFLCQQLLRQVVEQVTLDGTFHGTCAELRIESGGGQELNGLVGHL